MSGISGHKMSKEAYVKIIQEDLAWLEKQNLDDNSLELKHIIEIVKASLNCYYPEQPIQPVQPVQPVQPIIRDVVREKFEWNDRDPFDHLDYSERDY